jgi:hypothetical protein
MVLVRPRRDTVRYILMNVTGAPSPLMYEQWVGQHHRDSASSRGLKN